MASKKVCPREERTWKFTGLTEKDEDYLFWLATQLQLMAERTDNGICVKLEKEEARLVGKTLCKIITPIITVRRASGLRGARTYEMSEVR